MTTFNENKFRQLILHIADRSHSDPSFGSIKLNKIMFYSDFSAYVRWGTPITGAEYIRLDRGPAPKLMAPIRESMKENQDIIIRIRNRFGLDQTQIIALKDPDLAEFTAAEIALVDKVIDLARDANATELSEASHGFLGWRIASDKETIPYEAALISNSPPTEAHISRVQELAAKYNW